MSAPAKCPVCSTKLQPEWESCPNCPMSFRDEAPQKAALDSDGFRNYVMPILLVCGFGYFIWSFGQYLLTTAEQATKPEPKVAKLSLTGPTVGSGVVPSDSRAIQGLVNEQVTGKFDPNGAAPPLQSQKPATAPKGPGIVSVMAGDGPPVKAVREWKLRGMIYDLITLKPVPGAMLTFTDNISNERVQIKADPRGRYRAILPPLVGGGYIVSVAKAGYEPTYMDPGIEGVPELPLERRQELAKDLSSLISQPFLFEPDSETPVSADFYLPPK